MTPPPMDDGPAAGSGGSAGRTATYTHYHSQFLAHLLTVEGTGDEALAKTLTSARVDMNPHQVDAALFALRSPLSKGVLLADEVGLGKTIEAALVMAQRWAERRRRILLVVPASLRKQWAAELWDKFGLPTLIMESRVHTERRKAGIRRPFEADNAVVVVSYEFAARKAAEIAAIGWDLVVLDEAHRLRNVHKQGPTSRARLLRDALRAPFKVLLTATPLQNSLTELYGLVSFMDEHVFGDELAFRTRFASGGREGLMLLRERLRPICLRTLRRTVMEAGHISYTRRTPVTFRFEPHPEEQDLYERVSEFLQRENTVYLGGKPNALVTMALRKILGSSSYAIALTLNRIIERLAEERRLADRQTLADLDTIEEMAEEMGADDDGAEDGDARPTPEQIAGEIAELVAFRDLAASIASNAKGERLTAELPGLMDAVVEKGGQRKAVIFTESVRTQTYLADLLSRNGFDGRIVLLNGSNNDPGSQRIYADWIGRHRGTDRVSGSKTADMKAAVVDAFRDGKEIMIATESGAEGINLQFCSLLVNYDLPWNPQRVEQRIGRCHRYGQKIDVTVVNLLNTKNKAEERVFELLSEKFQLFEGVFGASDEVLGAIESGVDFEKRVHEIMQRARSAEEVKRGFDELTESLKPQIEADMKAAREKLLLNVDEDVVRLLKERGESLKRTLGDFERRLILLAQAELPEAVFREHADGSPVIEHEGQVWTTGWPLADHEGWQFFRLAEGNLAADLAERAMTRTLPLVHVRFSYGAFQRVNGSRLTDVESLVGRSGWLRVGKLALRTQRGLTEQVLGAAVTDDGERLDGRCVERLFLLPGTEVGAVGDPPSSLIDAAEAVRAEMLATAGREQERLMFEEEEKLRCYGEDQEKAAEAEIKQMQKEHDDRARSLRLADGLSMQQRIDEKRSLNLLQAAITEKKAGIFERQRSITARISELLDEAADSLRAEPSHETLFTIRWTVTA